MCSSTSINFCELIFLTFKELAIKHFEKPFAKLRKILKAQNAKFSKAFLKLTVFVKRTFMHLSLVVSR